MLRLLLPLLAVVLCMAAEAPPYTAWNEYLGSADSAQYSSLREINQASVRRLAVAWTYSTGDSRQYLFNPLMADGKLFVLAKNNSLVALDPASGRELWVHSFQGPVTTRGINYWQSADGASRRLFTINGGFLTAIDARTGENVLSFGDNGRTDLRIGLNDRDWSLSAPIQTNNPGRVFENLIIVPLMRSGGDYAYLPGDIHAYDVRTGKLVWVFHTVPRPGEFGYETWPKDFWMRSGGGINWNELSVDERRGIAYVPTGTGKFDHYGADRRGQNLFANSVIALDARSGKRLWHFQTVHHDLWDYDLPAGPKLLTVKHNGKSVDVAAQPTKQGFLFVLDRVTGEPLWPVEERAVPKSDVAGEQAWPTQPFPTAPPPFARQRLTESDINPLLPAAEQKAWGEKLRNVRNEGLFTPPSLRGTLSVPGVGGGASWATAAVDPERGRLYIVSHDAPTIITLVPKGSPGADSRAANPPQPAPIPADGPFIHYTAPYTQLISAATHLPAITPPWFTMTGYDLNKGTILWQTPYGTVPALTELGRTGTGVLQQQRGGPVVTAGGLIFAATNDRKLRAYDEDTGKVIWEAALPAAAEGVPAVYEVGGREYIVVCAAAGNEPAVTLEGRTVGEAIAAPGAYIAFALPKP
jgi:quinoprotein glucose dehydrogenase